VLRLTEPRSGPRVCDPQRLRPGQCDWKLPGRAGVRMCCGSQSRAPDRGSATRSGFARVNAFGNYRDVPAFGQGLVVLVVLPIAFALSTTATPATIGRAGNS
jgi:hypothetical protein